MAQFEFPLVLDFIHDALHEGGFSFAVLSNECHLLAPFDDEVHIVEHDLLPIFLGEVFRLDGDGAGVGGRREFQVEAGVVLFVHFDSVNLLQLLDSGLHLYGFGCLVAEAFDEILRVLNLFLLVLVGAELLFPAFLAEFHIFGVGYLVVVNLAQGDFDGSVGDSVDEGAVVGDQDDGATAVGEEILQPLDGFDVEVVGRLVEQQHVRVLQQDFCQFDAHTPTTAEFACLTFEVFSFKSEA